MKTHLNPELEVFGVVMTMYDSRTRLAQQVVEEVRDFFERQGVRDADSANRAAVRGAELRPAGDYSTIRRARAPRPTENLAKEVMDRV